MVFDPGHGSFRAGYAGEDAPKADIPTVIGVWEDDSCVDPVYIYQMGNGQKKYNIGLPAIKVLKRGILFYFCVFCSTYLNLALCIMWFTTNKKYVKFIIFLMKCQC